MLSGANRHRSCEYPFTFRPKLHMSASFPPYATFPALLFLQLVQIQNFTTSDPLYTNCEPPIQNKKMVAPRLLLAFLASLAFASPLHGPFHYDTTSLRNDTAPFRNATALLRNATAPFHNHTRIRDSGDRRSIIRPCTDGSPTTLYSKASSWQTRSYYPTATTSPLPITTLTPVLTAVRSSSSVPSSFTTSVSLGSTCSTAASPPAPTQPGAVSGCSKWVVAESGDTCYQIADKFGISTDTFMAWNPAVNPPKCTQLLAGDAYCVQVCGDTSLTSISTSFTPLPSSTASGPAPSLTQGPHDTYHAYCGDGSVGDGWPSMDQWLDFNTL